MRYTVQTHGPEESILFIDAETDYESRKIRKVMIENGKMEKSSVLFEDYRGCKRNPRFRSNAHYISFR